MALIKIKKLAKKKLALEDVFEHEYFGVDTELPAEVIDFLAYKSGRRADDCTMDTSVRLDEYELAMLG